jgi:endonuclease/exonuclease/phosphatase family metal-dependent hydrolase
MPIPTTGTVTVTFDWTPTTVYNNSYGYPYVAIAVGWESNYIPFPYWPFNRHFGRVKSGGAILSRYPIVSQEIVLLQKPLSQPWWYNLFYPHRYFQKIQIDLGHKKISLINLHLEAYDKINRAQQIQLLASKIIKEKIDFVAGDFNMLPPSAAKKSRFITNKDEYENDQSYFEMMKSGLFEVIPDDIYALDEATYMTFPASKPERRLDYIFYEKGIKKIKAEILPSALSDHLPLKAIFQISNPNFNPYSQ